MEVDRRLFGKGVGATSRQFAGNSFQELFSELESCVAECWEKRPAHISGGSWIKRKPFSKSDLIKVLKQNELGALNNLKAVKYIDGNKTSWEFVDDGIVTHETATRIFHDGFTMQFFQPQRFSDSLHEIIAWFEQFFSALSGSSAYLTPPSEQGLAPHHDDVEVFILQCEGSKKWKLWPPFKELPETYSGDIDRSRLREDESVEIVLNPGDVLYLPRGTIHEAIALESFSTHVTISTYQRYNMKTFLKALAPKLIDSAFEASVDMRRGLPIAMGDSLGSFASLRLKETKVDEDADGARDKDRTTETRRAFLTSVSAALHQLVALVDQSIVDEAADEVMGDFVMHRIPPHPSSVDTEGASAANLEGTKGTKGAPAAGTEGMVVAEQETFEEWTQSAECARGHKRLSRDVRINICHPRSIFCMVMEIDGVSVLALANSRFNSRAMHMGHPSDWDDDLGSPPGDDNNGEDEDDDGDGDDEDGDDDDDDDDEEGGGEGPEDSPWILDLPVRMAPVVTYLQSQHASGGVRVSQVVEAMREKNIFPDEVLETVHALWGSGFLTQEKGKEKEKDKERDEDRPKGRVNVTKGKRDKVPMATQQEEPKKKRKKLRS